MKTIFFCISLPMVVAAISGSAVSAQALLPEDDPANPRVIPISNEVSFYRNVDDDGVDRGRTLQIISINMFNIGTDFIVEFTGDFNWDAVMSREPDYDYYIELSLVKPVYKSLSLNYQRIYGTFADGPINQFGIRVSFFSGS